MSSRNPIIAVTGSSGAGTSFVKRAVEAIFERENLKVAIETEKDGQEGYQTVKRTKHLCKIPS